MNNRAFLTAHSGIYTLFALALFFMPNIMWPMYGVEINDQYAYFLSQHTSIFLGGIAVISWLLRDIEPGKLAKNLFLALAILTGLGVFITAYAGVTGVFAGLGWSDPAFFSILLLLSFIQFKKQ